MEIREFRYYQFLAEKGLCSPIVCMNDPEHGFLFSNINDEDKITLFCLVCSFSIIPGITFFDTIRKKIHEITKDSIDDIREDKSTEQ